MTGEPEENAGREEAAGTTDTWQEVGKQFQRLGESLSSAFRNARENEDNRRTLRNLSEGLGSLASEVGKAIDEVASSDEGQWVRQEAEKAARTTRIPAGTPGLKELKEYLARKIAAEKLTKKSFRDACRSIEACLDAEQKTLKTKRSGSGGTRIFAGNPRYSPITASTTRRFPSTRAGKRASKS